MVFRSVVDIYEDQFAKKAKAKRERVAKNELQRLRNVARRMKGKGEINVIFAFLGSHRNLFFVVPGVGLTPVEKPDKDHLQHALTAAKKSDASLGRFSERVAKEDKYSAKTGKKRKVCVLERISRQLLLFLCCFIRTEMFCLQFEPNLGDLNEEKKASLKILNSVSNKKPMLNLQKAVGQHMSQEEHNNR